MASPKKHKLDIFKVLSQISTKDRNFYSSLEDDQKKALQPLVVMRWLSGTKNIQQIYFLNELVNPFVFSMHNHKELLIDLMMCCTSGKSQRYYWNKAQSKKTSSTPHLVSVVKDFFGYNTRDAMEALPLLTDEDLICREARSTNGRN